MISKNILLLLGLQTFSVCHSYSIPEKITPYIENLSPYESSFLRDRTPVSVIGILVERQNGRYKLNDDTGKSFSLPLEIAPSIKIDKKLLNKKVKVNGRLTYQVIYFSNKDGTYRPEYTFNFEVYNISEIN